MNIAYELLVSARFRVREQVGQSSPRKFLLRTAFDRLETRRDPRFRRKGGEERLGEAVNGLDAKAARCFQDLGEQAPRPLPGTASSCPRRWSDRSR